MAIKLKKRIEIDCDTCNKIIATGKITTKTLLSFEENEKYNEIYCTDCVKPSKE